MLSFISIIAVIILYFSLSKKIEALQKKYDLLISDLSKKAVPEQRADPLNQSAQPIQTNLSTNNTSATPTEAFAPGKQEFKETMFVAWLKEDFLLKAGAFLLLIALAWFVNYAFANNWIGPIGRISLGICFGSAVLSLGVWRIKDFLHQGSIFIALGACIAVLSIYAAREVYDLFTPAVSLGMIFIFVSFVSFISVRYRYEPLALIGLLLASLAPLLTASPDASTITLFSYLLVVVLGTLWVSYLITAKALTILALVVVGLYSAPYILELVTFEDKLIVLGFSFVFTVIFFFANILNIVFAKISSIETEKGNVLTAMGIGLFLAAWISVGAPEEWQTILYAAWMVVFSVGTFLVYLSTRQRLPFYMYGAISIGLLAAATAVEFEGPLLTTAYIYEAFFLIVIITLSLKNERVSNALALLLAGPVTLSLQSILSSKWEGSVLHQDAFVLMSMLLVTLGVGLLFKFVFPKDSHVNNTATSYSSIFFLVSGGYAFVLLWLSLHAILVPDVATMVALIVYTIVGLLLYFVGLAKHNNEIKVVGGVVLGAVIVRLLLVEIWQMDVVGRIITFFIIGILLMSSAFITKLYQNHE